MCDLYVQGRNNFLPWRNFRLVGKQKVAVCLHFIRAFDKVFHYILVDPLEKYWLEARSVGWFRNHRVPLHKGCRVKGGCQVAKEDLWCCATRFCSRPWCAKCFWQNASRAIEKMPIHIHGWYQAKSVGVCWVMEPLGYLDGMNWEALFSTYFWTRIKLEGNQKIYQGSRLILTEAVVCCVLWLCRAPKKIHQINSLCGSAF